MHYNFIMSSDFIILLILKTYVRRTDYNNATSACKIISKGPTVRIKVHIIVIIAPPN